MKSTTDSRYVWPTAAGPVDLTADAIALSTQEAGGADGRSPHPNTSSRPSWPGWASLCRPAWSSGTTRINQIWATSPLRSCSKHGAPVCCTERCRCSTAWAISRPEHHRHRRHATAVVRSRYQPSRIPARAAAPRGAELIVGVVRAAPSATSWFSGSAASPPRCWACRPCASRRCPKLTPAGWSLVPGPPVLDRGSGPSRLDLEASSLRCWRSPVAAAWLTGSVTRSRSSNATLWWSHRRGAAALDARLVLAPPAQPPRRPGRPATDPTRLFAPGRSPWRARRRTVPGLATDSSPAIGTWDGRDGLYAIHPTAGDVDDVPAVNSVADIPGGLDYLLVAVPAQGPDARPRGRRRGHRVRPGRQRRVRRGRRGGARLQAELAAAFHGRIPAARAKLHGRLLHPAAVRRSPCAHRGSRARLGRVAERRLVGRPGDGRRPSGAAVQRGGQRRQCGRRDVGELVRWLVQEPQTAVIGLYVEGTRDGVALLLAMRRAPGAEPLVILRGGSSEQGSTAVASHTGAMTGGLPCGRRRRSDRGHDGGHPGRPARVPALAGPRTGRCPAGPRPPTACWSVGAGGGASVLATDACDRAGLTLVPYVKIFESACAPWGMAPAPAWPIRSNCLSDRPAAEPCSPMCWIRILDGGRSALPGCSDPRECGGVLQLRDRRPAAATWDLLDTLGQDAPCLDGSPS